MEIFWVFINTNQLLFLAPLIGVPLPSNAFIFYKILAFAHGEFYIIVLIYTYTLGKLAKPSPS